MLAHRCDVDGVSIVALHNVGDASAEVDLTLAGEAAGVRLADLFTAGSELTVGAGGAVTVPLAPYGTHWFRVLRDGERWLT